MPVKKQASPAFRTLVFRFTAFSCQGTERVFRAQFTGRITMVSYDEKVFLAMMAWWERYADRSMERVEFTV